MAAIAALDLLVTLVSISTIIVFFFAITCVTAEILFASLNHHFAGNFDLPDTQPVFGLYTDVPGDT